MNQADSDNPVSPKDLFVHNGAPDRLLLPLWLLISVVILVNVFRHDPIIGYDAYQYRTIIAILPERIPTAEDTYEYFSPPLPFLLPSIVHNACGKVIPLEYRSVYCSHIAGKAGQLINAGFAITISLWLLHLASLLPGDIRINKLATLALFGILTVHYKTFVMIRGEPYVAFFSMWAFHRMALLISAKQLPSWRQGIGLGLLLSGMALSRQWGVLALPAVGLFPALAWRAGRPLGQAWARTIATAALVTLFVGGSWYFFLLAEYGKLTPFVAPNAGFSFSNHPPTFYQNTGLADFQLFRQPTRPIFDNMLFPVYYSEIWGDYWGYFVFVRENTRLGSQGFANRLAINPLLGRANLLGVIPTFLYLAGIATGILSLGKVLLKGTWTDEHAMAALATMIVFSGALGYLWFLIAYPLKELEGDHIKAVYLLHVIHLLPLLGARFLAWLRSVQPKLASFVWLWLGFVYLLNFPIWLSRYVQ